MSSSAPSMEPPPYSATPGPVAPSPNLSNAITSASNTTSTVAGPASLPPTAALPRQPPGTGFLRPKPLPSPWDKAPKTKVTNFRQGLAEGSRCAVAHVREGMKAPVGMTWDGMAQGVKDAGLFGGLLGGVGGVVCGAVHLGLSPVHASIVFLNHSSRGAIRGARAGKGGPFPTQPEPSTANESSSPAADHKPLSHEIPTVSSSSPSLAGLTSTSSSPRNEKAGLGLLATPIGSSGEGLGTPPGANASGVEEREASQAEMEAKWGSGR